MTEIRVLHVVTGLRTGGAENMLLRVVRSVECSAIRHRVVALSGGPMYQRFIEGGIDVKVLQLNSFLDLFRVFRLLRNAIREWDPQVIQGWMYHGNLAATCAAGFARRKRVVWNIRQTLYGLGNEKWVTALVIRLCRIASRVTGAIIYNSHVSIRQHEAFGFNSKSSIYIGNGVDTDACILDPQESLRSRRALGIDRVFVAGLAARAHPMKAHSVFLRAAALAAEDIQGIVVVLAGDKVGSDQEIQNTIQTEGIRARVICLGELSDMSEFYRLIDLCVLSSAWGEGFPNVLAEAMASGVPCLTTAVGDAPSVVGNPEYVVPVGDVSGMAKAMVKLAKLSPSDRFILGGRARQRAVDRFDMRVIAGEYARLYTKIATMSKGGQ